MKTNFQLSYSVGTFVVTTVGGNYHDRNVGQLPFWMVVLWVICPDLCDVLKQVVIKFLILLVCTGKVS